ncbi:DHHA1 domain-containing protein [Roseibium sp. Sym1]|uniref:DHHA1 domain-containing protein n=1 Tax=Roseibium sp. Sym1 TaxID=3016006 RepID=UPI0022B52726|nr:DHHA1 domain-containing protein [Roseibium sp. Sym1]
MKTICLYHGNCADGFTAAWIVRNALGECVEFIPATHGSEPPDVTGAEVIIVDFSYKRQVLLEMAKEAESVLVLDHHKTAQEDLTAGEGIIDISGWSRPWGISRHRLNAAQDQLEGAMHANIYVEFDMERSGAQMVWDFFNLDQPRKRFVDFVGDRDLWHFKMPCSRQVAATVFSYPYTFDAWDHLDTLISSDIYLAGVVAQGDAILRKHDKDVAELLEATTRTMVIGGVEVPVANLPYTMSSDAANLLAEKAPFGACYFDNKEGKRVFSLRSSENGADVAEIAARYGGGGHKNAAGFRAPAGWCGDGSRDIWKEPDVQATPLRGSNRGDAIAEEIKGKKSKYPD